MPTFNFIGGSAGTAADASDSQRCVNLMLETNASRTGSTQDTNRALLATPGRELFASLPTLPVQCEYEAAQRGFVVSGWTLYEVFADGTFKALGLLNAGSTCCMTASQTELLVSNGAQGYVFNLSTSAFQLITDPGWLGGSSVDFQDGYFFAVEPDSQVFTISGLNTGLSWNALDFGDAEGRPENVVGMIISHREAWFLCSDHGEPYIDSGDSNFPWSRLSGADVDQGLASPRAVNLCDNTIFWLGQNKDGGGICWRANGYTPSRFSTYKVEAALAAAGDLSGASSYPYQENGHTFWRLDFADQTWVYDVGENEWHERGPFNGTTGLYEADLARFHMYVWGKHIVGDYASGKLYVQSTALLTDNGAAFRRVRRAPVISKEDKLISHGPLRIAMKTGGVAEEDDPQIVLRISDDGGSTFGDDRPAPMGKIGEYAYTIEWRRNGQAQRRVYEVVVEIPSFVAFTNAFAG